LKVADCTLWDLCCCVFSWINNGRGFARVRKIKSEGREKEEWQDEDRK